MMKYKLILILGVLFVAFTGCEDITDLNEDPNEPLNVPPVNLVTEAQYELNDLLWSRAFNAEWSMLMVQHWAQNEYTEEQRYDVDGNAFNEVWASFYADVLNELSMAKEMIQNDETILDEGLRSNQVAIIDILLAHGYHNLTDAFGAVPFTQALSQEEFPLPQYDSQEQIYNDILVMLENASKSLTSASPSFASGDLIYQGDVESWRRLANSLQLRVAMRMVDVDESTASGYIQSAYGNDGSGLILENSQNALFVFSSDANIANPLYIDNVINTRDDFAVTEELVTALEAAGDPRLQEYAAPNNTGDIVGIPYGLTDGEAFALKSNTSRPSDRVRAATAPAVIMDAAEVHFLLAEAYQRGILTGDAAAAYADGITASMNYWGITDEAAIADYIANNPYDAGNWKASIGLQKWFAFYMNGPQAWAEQRRLDQPVLEVPEAALINMIPVRLPYPVTEQTRNGSSLGAVTSNPDDLTAKMWWDVN